MNLNMQNIFSGKIIDNIHDSIVLTEDEFSVDEKYNVIKFGNNVDSISDIRPIYDGSVPLHGIVIWSGTINDIPEGFQVCDGTNGTPDLRNLFVKSISSINQTPNKPASNGSYYNTISLSQMPSHNHSYTENPHTHYIPNHTHTVVLRSIDTTTNHGHNLPCGGGVNTDGASSYARVDISTHISAAYLSYAGHHRHNIPANTTTPYYNGTSTHYSGASASGNTLGNVGGDILNVQKNGRGFENREYNNQPHFYKVLFIMKMRDY